MIKIHKIMTVDNEHLYGPGIRILLFLQGCSIRCKGCINKQLWKFDGGVSVSAQEILELVRKENACGITLHGGEPLDQAKGLYDIVELLKDNGLTTILFTGYQKKELNKEQIKVWDKSELVVSGRFVEKKKSFNLQFRGSTNQRIITHKGPYKNYKVYDGFTTAIITVDSNGNMDVNGFLTKDIEKLIGKGNG